jgi:hypothetical protein
MDVCPDLDPIGYSTILDELRTRNLLEFDIFRLRGAALNTCFFWSGVDPTAVWTCPLKFCVSKRFLGHNVSLIAI